eukprot:TRINITY_DN9316_c0_g1_i1.p1 TRINITY_DN9316_c0_g1~~TRINITY_DN9316_c0_g1_i1.p1  ORF type:complete len:420 (-),score=105.09 TRINITY_DN9316_c0_g1_i1:28-1287(-)
MASEYTQPVIFETPGGDDLGEVEVGQIPSSLSRPLATVDNDAPIVVQRLDPTKAFDKFSKTEFDTRGKDFSDAVSVRARKTKYEVISRNAKRDTIGPVEESDLKETPLQRFERLKAEVSNFLTEISEAKADAASEEDGVDLSDMASQLKVLHSQLLSAKGDVSQVFSSEDLTAIGASKLTAAGAADGNLSKYLASHLQSLKPAAESGASKDQTRAIYELYYKPDLSKEDSTLSAKLFDAEKRLALLEGVLAGADTHGSAASTLFENSKGLVGNVLELKSRIDSLSDDNLSKTSRRIDQLIARVEQIQQSRSQNAPLGSSLITSEHLRKIESIHSALPKVDRMATELPVIIERLVQLRTLHEEAAAINNSWTQLTTEQSELSASVSASRALLTKMEENLAANMETMMKNVQVLEQKLAKK